MAGQNSNAYLYGSKAQSSLQVPGEGAGSWQKLTAMLYTEIASDNEDWVELFLDGTGGSQRLVIPDYHQWYLEAKGSYFTPAYTGDFQNLNFSNFSFLINGVRNNSISLIPDAMSLKYLRLFYTDPTYLGAEYGDTITNSYPTSTVQFKIELDQPLFAIRIYVKNFAGGTAAIKNACLSVDIWDMKLTSVPSASSSS
jgi:hypothetical protein